MTSATSEGLETYLQAIRVFAAIAENSAEAAGLTLAQMRLLLTLDDLGAASCSAVAGRLGVSVSSVTRLVARASMSPLVHRETSPTNASAINLSLTKAGAGTVDLVTVRRAQLLRQALAGLDPELASITTTGLAALCAALTENEPENEAEQRR